MRRLLARNLGTLAGAFLIGAAVQIYLPLASLRDPSVDWGHPATWPRLLDHLAATRIRRAFGAQMGVLEWTRFSHFAGLYLERMAEVLTYPGLALTALGGYLSLRSSRVLGAALVLLLLADFLFSTLVNPMGLEDRQTGLAGEVLAAILASVAVAEILGRGYVALSAGRTLAGALGLSGAIAIGGALVAWAALQGTGDKLRHGDSAAGEIVESTLAELPARSVLLTRSDDLSAGVLYQRAVEGARPDIVSIVRQHVWDRPYLRRAAGDLADPAAFLGDREERIAHQAETATRLVARARAQGRTVAWEPAEDDGAAGAPLKPAGLLFQVESAATGLAPRLATLLSKQSRLTAATRRYVATMWDRRGRARVAMGLMKPAMVAFRRALQLSPGAAQSWNNLAALLQRLGSSRQAIEAQERAVKEAPLSAVHWSNLGLFYLRANRDAAARRAYERARELEPRDPRPLVGLGILAARAGSFGEARRLLLRGLDAGASGDTREDALANLRKLGAPP
jgi:Flp pilus assembly protein TadD